MWVNKWHLNFKKLINVLWCTLDTTICKEIITCKINSFRQQINSEIWESSSPKTSSGKNKQRNVSKRPTEYWGLFANNFRYKNKELILQLYKSLVRPHLEHAVQFLSLHLRLDIDQKEKIERRATKMIPEIGNHNCHQRIQDLDLISLVQWRLRGQLIEVFKYLDELLYCQRRIALRLWL